MSDRIFMPRTLQSWTALMAYNDAGRWALATLPLGKAFLSALDGEDSMLCDMHAAVLDLLYVLDHPTTPAEPSR